MEHVDYRRQTLLFNPVEFDKQVCIVGLGNIGSHAATTLAHLGIKHVVLYDDDKVEIHNLSSQNYDINDLGKNKAICIAGKISAINPDLDAIPFNVKYEGQPTLSMSKEILIIAIDTMLGRKAICKKLKELPPESRPEYIIDGRVGGNQIELYTCQTPEDWEKTFSDKVSHDPCGGRYIAYVSTIIGGLITNQVKKILKGEKWDKSLMMDVNSLQVVKNFEW
jgi:hypothetical protein